MIIGLLKQTVAKNAQLEDPTSRSVQKQQVLRTQVIIVTAMCKLKTIISITNPKPNYLLAKLPSKTITIKIILM